MNVFPKPLFLAFICAILTSLSYGHGHGSPQGKAIAKLITASRAFIDSLDEKQRALTLMAFDEDERFNWKFVPAERKGINFKYLDDKQELLAHNLLRAALSADGYWKTTTIIDLEVVLFEKEGAAYRDPDLYYISLFGEPSSKGKWGFRFEGHHLSLNYTIVEGKLIAAAPQFWGANPAIVMQGSRKGVRALAKENDLALELFHSLDGVQRANALLQKEAYKDIITMTAAKVNPFASKGAAFGKMNKTQRVLLMSLIREYVDNMPEALAKKRFAALKEAGLGGIRFGWAGEARISERHYYRIQGPTFLIEFDNRGNHIHSVWRDFDGDFGRNIIGEHYANHNH